MPDIREMIWLFPRQTIHFPRCSGLEVGDCSDPQVAQRYFPRWPRVDNERKSIPVPTVQCARQYSSAFLAGAILMQGETFDWGNILIRRKLDSFSSWADLIGKTPRFKKHFDCENTLIGIQ